MLDPGYPGYIPDEMDLENARENNRKRSLCEMANDHYPMSTVECTADMLGENDPWPCEVAKKEQADSFEKLLADAEQKMPLYESLKFIHNIAVFIVVSVANDTDECKVIKIPLKNRDLARLCYCKKITGDIKDIRDMQMFSLTCIEALRRNMETVYTDLGFKVIHSFVGIDDSTYTADDYLTTYTKSEENTDDTVE